MIINGINLSKYNLKLKDDYIISPAIPKYKKISISGANGMLDLTTLPNGVTPFENRTITSELVYVGDKKDWHEVYSDISELLLGRVNKIRFPLDPSYYWEGTCEVDSYVNTRLMFVIVITANVFPFKYKMQSTAQSLKWDDINFEKSGWLGVLYDIQVDGELTIQIPENIFDTTPVITSSVDMKVVINGKTYDVTKGTRTYYEIILKKSNNSIRFIGNGVISFDIKRGRL